MSTKKIIYSKKFKPGQRYVTNRGYGEEIHTYIGVKPKTNARVWCSPREELWSETYVSTWREYKEPILHTAYVHWLRGKTTGLIQTSMSRVKRESDQFSSYELLKVDTVQYIEK